MGGECATFYDQPIDHGHQLALWCVFLNRGRHQSFVSEAALGLVLVFLLGRGEAQIVDQRCRAQKTVITRNHIALGVHEHCVRFAELTGGRHPSGPIDEDLYALEVLVAHLGEPRTAPFDVTLVRLFQHLNTLQYLGIARLLCIGENAGSCNETPRLADVAHRIIE